MTNCHLIFLFKARACVGNFGRKRQQETDIKRGQEGEISQRGKQKQQV